MKHFKLLTLLLAIVSLFAYDVALSQTMITIGTGTSSSSTRGPFQRSDSASSSVYSRANLVYTQTELNDVGMTGGVEISQIDFYNKSGSNIIDATGDAILNVYMRNTSNADATADSAWTDIIMGSTLVGTYTFNIANNFLGADDWETFILDSPFLYTGETLEIAVQWDCSGLTSTNGNPNLLFTGNGALKWRWSPTSHISLGVRAGGSSPPSMFETSSHFKSERANIRIYFDTPGGSCAEPSDLNATTVSATEVDLNWGPVADATSYNWTVVAAGNTPADPAIASGSETGTSANANTLEPLSTYDLFVQADCGATGTSDFEGPYSFSTPGMESDTVQIGFGTSSSSTRGPFQRSDTASSTVFSRFVHIYTSTELAAAGISDGDVITSINWELASENIVQGDGSANLKVYVRNSSATEAISDSWDNHISGSTLVFNKDFNTINNFPGEQGWMSFAFNTPIAYNGDAFEVAVDWDCSQVSTPALTGDGSLKWRWESTAPANLVVKKTSSSSSSSDITDLKDERANIQFVYSSMDCITPSGLDVTAITENSAELSWSATAGSSAYNWKIVPGGAGSAATAVESGNTMNTMASVTGLMPATSYDLFVNSECDGSGESVFAGPFNFVTNNPIGISEIDLIDNLSIAPNPSNGVSIVDIDFSQTVDLNMSLYSSQGKLLQSIYHGRTNKFRQSLDLRVYNEGIYFIQISADGNVFMKRIIYTK